MESQGWTWLPRSMVAYLCPKACRTGQGEYNHASHSRSNAFILWYEETVGPTTWIGFACFVWYGLSGKEFRYFVYSQEVLSSEIRLVWQYQATLCSIWNFFQIFVHGFCEGFFLLMVLSSMFLVSFVSYILPTYAIIFPREYLTPQF
jgi:hypothetical protein